MFTHILLPTDGSPLSEAAVQKGIQFAKRLGARVTGLHVIVPSPVLPLGTDFVKKIKDTYYDDYRLQAENYLAVIERAAKEAGVPCDTTFVNAPHAYEATIKTAIEKGCDCIVMASHGRKGVAGILIGSETAKVLTHTTLPVLVLH